MKFLILILLYVNILYGYGDIEIVYKKSNKLHILAHYGGGCKKHEFILNVDKIKEHSAFLTLIDITKDDPCEAYLPINLILDIPKEINDKNLIIKGEDWKEEKYYYVKDIKHRNDIYKYFGKLIDCDTNNTTI